MPALTFSDFVQMMRSFQESRLLLTAVELDAFTAVGAGGSAEEIAGRLKTDPRATDAFLNALVAVGALAKENGRFRNVEELSRRLAADSPDPARAALMHTVHMWDAWSGLTESIRRGTAAVRPGAEIADEQWTESFIAAMHRNAQTQAGALVQAVGTEGIRRMLDVGGGSGAYAIAFAQANPNLNADILDQVSVVRIAQRHIADARLTDRVSTRAGDLTADDLGSGYDLILLSAICHMLSPAQNQDLLRRCYLALADGGRVVIRDFILDADRSSPRPAALFALHMLVNTRGGSTYSEQEYRDWLEAAGFGHVSRIGAGDLLAATRQVTRRPRER